MPESRSGAVLVLTPSVGAAWRGDRLLIDQKAASGLEIYAELWPGRVRCIFREATGDLTFASEVDPATLPFEVEIIAAGAVVPDRLIDGAAVVLGTADNYLDLPLAEQCRRLGVPLVYVIEYIPETRLQIVDLDRLSLPRRWRRKGWEITIELKRRQAMARATAIQSNGTPAADSYAKLGPPILTFFDTRTRDNMLATAEEMAKRAKRLRDGKPIRLAFSGRLERMKGVDHLVRVANLLDQTGLAFELDIFGSGSLREELQDYVDQHGLRGRVRVNAPLSFETELVPWMREHADLFLCCHPQSDPSCTYMETLACGVPIAGFANRAWTGILERVPVGWSVPIGDEEALAQKVIELDRNREVIIEAADAALEFARENTFEKTFRRRVDQLIEVAGISIPQLEFANPRV